MKLKIIALKENQDFRSGIKIIYGDVTLRFLDGGEPEDASLGRDYNDVYLIVELIKKICPTVEIEETEEDLDSF